MFASPMLLPILSLLGIGATALLLTSVGEKVASLLPGGVTAALTQQKPLAWKPLGEPGSGGWITSFAISPYDDKRMLIGGDMLGIGLSTDGGKTWEASLGLKSYEIGDFTWHPTDPRIVWVGTMSGPYLSRDGGKTWEEKRGGFPPYGGYFYSAPVEKVLFDPTNVRHVLAFGGSSRRWESPGQPDWGAVWESRDSGENWTKIADLDKNIVGAAWVSGSAKELLIAVAHSGIWRSSDSGKTWQQTGSGLPHHNVERVIAHPRDPKIAWAALENHKPEQGDCLPGGIYKTTDGGNTWFSISNGLSQRTNPDPNFTARYKAFAVCLSQPDIMYTADSAWNTGVLYGTRDGGKNWAALATRGNIGNDDNDPARRKIQQVRTAYFAGIGGTVMAADPKNPEVAFCLGSEHLIATRDGGKTWADEGNDPVGANAWSGRGYSGLCCVNFYFNPKRSGDALLVALDAGKLWRSTDNLRSWTYHGEKPWPWGGGGDACFAGNHIYGTAGQFGQFQGIIRSADDGKTWEVLGGKDRGLPEFGAGNSQPGAIYARPDRPSVVRALIAGKLYASDNAGEKWTVLQEGLELNWLAGDTRDPAILYLSGKGGVYLSTDGGKTLKSLGGPRPATRLTVDSRGRLYAASWREAGGVWRYTEGKWTRLWDEKFVYHIAADPKNPSRIAVATQDHPYHDVCSASGVWVSGDDGKSWRPANDGLPVLRGESVTFDPHTPGRLVFGTHGRGFFVTNWPEGYLPPTTARSYTHTDADTEATKPGSVVAAVKEAPAKAEPVAAGGAGALLQNGDMEQGEGIPTDWEGKWVGRGSIRVSKDTGIVKAGKASLLVESDGGSAMGQASQVIEARAGTKITLSGFVRSRGNVRVNVGIQPFNANWGPITFIQAKYIQNDSDWTEFKHEVTLPEGTERTGILLLIDGEGKAWLDEVRITRGEGKK